MEHAMCRIGRVCKRAWRARASHQLAGFTGWVGGDGGAEEAVGGTGRRRQRKKEASEGQQCRTSRGDPHIASHTRVIVVV